MSEKNKEFKSVSSKGKYIKKYFAVFGVIMAIFGISFGSGVYIYQSNLEPPYLESNQIKDWDRLAHSDENQQSDDNGVFSAPPRTNFLLIGRDKIAGLTDTIIAGTFVSATGEISMVSIPRDLYTTLERDKVKELNDAGRNPPRYFKLNSLYNYAGRGDRGLEYLKNEVSDVLGIKFDYYAMIDTEGFRSVVDTIGGIDFEVPEGGLHYSDPGQDLYIDLKGGMQHLNGSQAEGLVRFRKGYATQDIRRMEVQQEFLKVFLKTVLSKESLSNNIKGLIADFSKYVETDFGINDITKYLSCLPNINAENVKSVVLPCDGKMIDGAYYFILKEDETKEVIDEYFFGIKKEEETSSESEINPNNENNSVSDAD